MPKNRKQEASNQFPPNLPPNLQRPASSPDAELLELCELIRGMEDDLHTVRDTLALLDAALNYGAIHGLESGPCLGGLRICEGLVKRMDQLFETWDSAHSMVAGMRKGGRHE